MKCNVRKGLPTMLYLSFLRSKLFSFSQET